MSSHSPDQSGQLTLERVEEKVLQAFRLWHTHDHEGSPLDGLQAYQQICNRNLCNSGQMAVRQATNELLRRGMDALRISHPDEHTIVSLRFTDEQSVQVVANRMNLAEGSILRKQQQGIHHIAEFLYQLESNLRATKRERLMMRLPISGDLHLVGLENPVAELLPILVPEQGPWIISIEGAPGIGKSGLAGLLCQKIIEMDLWKDFAWVSLQKAEEALNEKVMIDAKCKEINESIVNRFLQQIAPASTASIGYTKEEKIEHFCRQVKDQAHLLVIDGVDEYPDLVQLFEFLARLTNPSKILLTSRLRNYHKSGAYHFTLGEISPVNSHKLLCHEANLRNLSDVADASEAEIYPLYQIIGGNPLATRLVVEQLHVYTLNQVLTDLTTATGDGITNLYHFLFKKTWQQLDDRIKLASFPLLLITETGDTFEEIALQLQCGIHRDELRQALEHYIKYCLLDVRGNYIERRYVIHHLTRTFLRQQISQWIFNVDPSKSRYTVHFECFVNETILLMRKQLELAHGLHQAILLEKTMYLLEYTLQHESLWISSIDLILQIMPMLNLCSARPNWFSIFKKALYIGNQMGDTEHESTLHSAIHALSAPKSHHAYRQDRALPAMTV